MDIQKMNVNGRSYRLLIKLKIEIIIEPFRMRP